MTTRRSEMHDDDRWIDDFARQQKRQHYALGLAVFALMALVTAAIAVYFSNMAAMPW